MANGTSTMALWPGSLGSFWGYRHEFRQAGNWVWWLLIPCLLGGLIGVLLVTEFPPSVRLARSVADFLGRDAVCTAAANRSLDRHRQAARPIRRKRRLAAILFFQLLVSIYGGYFGAGAGILMLAALAMMGLPDIHVMNAVKTLYGTTINIMASIVFIVRGKVDWRLAIADADRRNDRRIRRRRVARRIDPALVSPSGGRDRLRAGGVLFLQAVSRLGHSEARQLGSPVVVVGAGAAGLVAAFRAAERGRRCCCWRRTSGRGSKS